MGRLLRWCSIGMFALSLALWVSTCVVWMRGRTAPQWIIGGRTNGMIVGVGSDVGRVTPSQRGRISLSLTSAGPHPEFLLHSSPTAMTAFRNDYFLLVPSGTASGWKKWGIEYSGGLVSPVIRLGPLYMSAPQTFVYSKSVQTFVYSKPVWNWTLTAPPWVWAAIFGAPAVIAMGLRRRQARIVRRRIAMNLCLSCGYDLCASPERCPECGAVANRGLSSPIARAAGRGRRIALAGALVVAAAIAITVYAVWPTTPSSHRIEQVSYVPSDGGHWMRKVDLDKGTEDTEDKDAPVNRVLDQIVPEVRWQKLAFADAVDQVRDQSGLNIFVNWRAIGAAGISTNAPISIHLIRQPFSAELDAMLEKAEAGHQKLGYKVEEGVVEISVRDDLASYAPTRIYDIRDLLGGVAGSRSALLDEVLAEIMDQVDPESWQGQGGKIGSIRELSGQLIIRNTPENQRKIVLLLENYRQRHPDVGHP